MVNVVGVKPMTAGYSVKTTVCSGKTRILHNSFLLTLSLKMMFFFFFLPFPAVRWFLNFDFKNLFFSCKEVARQACP